MISDVQAVFIPTVNLSSGTFGGAPNVAGGYEAILQNDTVQPVTITFTPNAGATPSQCFLSRYVAVAVKPVNQAGKQKNLAAIPPKCGDAGAYNFNPGVTTSVTIPAGESCQISCGSGDVG